MSHTGLRVGSETHRLVNTEDLGSLKEEEDVVQYWKYSAASGDPAAQALNPFLLIVKHSPVMNEHAHRQTWLFC